MKMKQISDSTIKITIQLEDLEERGMEIADFLVPQEKTEEFFYAISYSALMNLHFKMLAGENDHHIIECAFKSFAKSLDAATMVDERITSVLSTKGTL